ncbi:MAG: type II toxin-antitoxin system VapC family toxin [Pseudomonadales bacterium]|nr:type II toxin-antitoxin system VapC family toxin [Pseudomonadales bacterium]
MLLDSNIIIYAAKPEYSYLCDFIANNTPFLSAISYVEVLGYHRLTPVEKSYFAAFFKEATVLPITEPILQTAISLKQQQKLNLGDSLIAATAICHCLTLVTRNTKDFEWIPNLRLLNPLIPC